MKISNFGTGYVVFVTGACLAEVDHHVVCMDVDINKIDNLRAGISLLREPGVDTIVQRSVTEGELHFSTDAAQAARQSAVHSRRRPARRRWFRTIDMCCLR